ncbi:MAG: hypothetical protein ACI8W8_003028, partial [Rhodothermales bacterium]
MSVVTTTAAAITTATATATAIALAGTRLIDAKVATFELGFVESADSCGSSFVV